MSTNDKGPAQFKRNILGSSRELQFRITSFVIQEPVAAHRLPALAGARISLTGFQPEVKKQYATLIERGGGAHSAELSKECTHLVAEAPHSDKYR